MVKIDIISGFLGAGKTTLIKKLLTEAFQGEQVVLIENEFGEIGIDGGFLKEAGIQIREMNSGCICCSLVGDFGASLKEVVSRYQPDRILIEPSGVGKLSDVIKAVQDVSCEEELALNSYTTVVDAKKCKMYMRNFGEFFNNQVEYAGAIIMSRTDIVDEEKAKKAMELLREINPKAAIITTPIEKLDGRKLLEVMEHPVSLEEELRREEEHHRHEHHYGDEECGCGHEHHHEHHHGDEECGCG
ncbi:MAG: GTP-binding protein, partial [Eubacteriales bacterium]|nr:GTP-binding protein [Eubacteriales bacterium]